MQICQNNTQKGNLKQRAETKAINNVHVNFINTQCCNNYYGAYGTPLAQVVFAQPCPWATGSQA